MVPTRSSARFRPPPREGEELAPKNARRTPSPEAARFLSRFCFAKRFRPVLLGKMPETSQVSLFLD
jgi:hypothetical protein